MQNKWLLSQQSKQKQNKIKFGIFTAMFLMQYFCLHGILPFSKSYPEIESTWPTGKCRERKSFHKWYYLVTCATFCVSFSSKSKAIYIFPKLILKPKAHDQSIQARKKLFCHVIVNNYLYNVSLKFLIKIESTWRREIKEQALQLTLRCRGRTFGSSHWRCYVRNLFLKVLQYPHQTPVLHKTLQTFGPATLLKRELSTWVFLWILQNF